MMDPNKIDPDAVLTLMREALARRDRENAAALADMLDGWLTAGGCLPAAWRRSWHHPHLPYEPLRASDAAYRAAGLMPDVEPDDGLDLIAGVLYDRATGREAVEGEGCPGHESLAGAHMGQSIECDGTCQG